MQLKNASVLVIDDDADVLTSLKLLLKTQVKSVVIEKNPDKLPSLLQSQPFDLVLLDMNFKSAINTGNEGFYWLNRIKSLKTNTSVIMITAYGEIDLAVRALKEGAIDFVVKPWQNEKLLNVITDALAGKDKKAAKETNQAQRSGLIGKSEAMQDVFFRIKKIAPTEANILILGENGTGKDLIAQAIHESSLRADKPFIKVDV